MPPPAVVLITTSVKDKSIAALLSYNAIQSGGATDVSQVPLVDNVVVASERAQQFGQSNTPLFLPLDKLDPALSDANRAEAGLTDQQAVYKQLGDNGVIPIFVTMVQLVDGKLTSDRWLTTTRVKYGISINPSDTSVTLSDPGNLPHSSGPGVTGVPTDADTNANYVEVISGATGQPVVVLAGPKTGERVYGVMTTGGSSPNSAVFDLYSRPLGGNPAGTRTPYSWEAGNGAVINAFYGFRQSLDQIDDTAFRRIFR